MEKLSTSKVGEPEVRNTERGQAYDLGIIDYARALRLQEQLVKARIADEIPDTILFLQHFPVITLGTSGKDRNILFPRDLLKNEGMALFNTDRGGDITVHEPGQLVGYPIINLTTKGRDLHQYVRNLEEVVIRTLNDYSIESHRDPEYPGVWVDSEKVCAIGIRVSKWVTKHGFALNINNDLKCFSYINPCGITDKGVTSMSRLLSSELDIKNVMLKIIEHFSQVFDVEIKIEESSGLLSRVT